MNPDTPLHEDAGIDPGVPRSATTSLDHRSLRDDFTDEHGDVPGVWGQVLALIALLLVIAGDFASFNIALARSFTTLSEPLVLLLTAAMTAAAVLAMVEAGRAEARRRSRNAGRAGKGPVRSRVLAWLLLGATAFLLRLAAPPEEGSSGGFGSGGFGSGAFGADTGFGPGFGGTTAAPDQFLGPLPLYSANLTSAMALMAIFIAGGVGAFWFGKEHYNPRLSAVKRAARRARRARFAVRRARRAQDRAQRRAYRLVAAQQQADEARERLRLLADLEHEVAQYEAAREYGRDLQEQAAALAAEVADARTALEAIPQRREVEAAQARQVGAEAKQRARVAIATYRGEPGATTGLTYGGRA